MPDLTCPNCGYPVTPPTRAVRMMGCGACDTSLLIEDDVIRNAGQQGVMHDVPMLFDVGDKVRLVPLRKNIGIKGHVRYSYGRGFWDEFWCIGEAGQSYWVSVDEGDVVLQTAVPPKKIRQNSPPALGSVFRHNLKKYRVVEAETAECVALRGAFDEALGVGETYRFVNAQGAGQTLLSGEFWSGGHRWYYGQWISPFDIKVLGREVTT